MNHIIFLLENNSTTFTNVIENVNPYKEFDDKSIIDFYITINGGGFFSNSLIMYPRNIDSMLSFEKMNIVVNKYYSKYIGNHTFFGCDIFGNQFGYDGNNIFFLNIESAQKEKLATSFKDFISLIGSDIDFYTGESFVKLWENKNKKKISIEKRLCPIYPFVIGGEYSIDKMYESNIYDVLSYNENIASQIFGLDEGTDIEIKLI